MSEDIKVTDGTILEALNDKIDIDGGNYPNSGLKSKIDSEVVNNTGDESINGIKTFNTSPKVPTASDSSNDTTAANTQWVTNKVKSTAVDLTSTQDITGRKTFKIQPILNSPNAEKITLKSQTIDLDVNPSIQQNNQIWFQDKNGNSYATLQANQNTDGSVGFSMTMKSKKSNSFSTINLTQMADGTGVAIAPSTADTATSNQIVTADFFNRKALQTTDISKAENGYVKLSNGLIIQWGTATASTFVNFPIPFSSDSSYQIGSTWTSESKYTSDAMLSERSATGFKFVNRNTSWIAIGY